MSGIEDSLTDAIKVSKLLYSKYAEECGREWADGCVSCTPGEIAASGYDTIDGVFTFDGGGRLNALYAANDTLRSDIEGFEGFNPGTEAWKRMNVGGREYLLVPAQGSGIGDVYLARVVPESTHLYTESISLGLQNYRTLKIVRDPIRVIVILFYVVGGPKTRPLAQVPDRRVRRLASLLPSRHSSARRQTGLG